MWHKEKQIEELNKNVGSDDWLIEVLLWHTRGRPHTGKIEEHLKIFIRIKENVAR